MTLVRTLCDECLLENFKFLARYDLFACLLTCRRFARVIQNAIPFLAVHKRRFYQLFSVLNQLSDAYCASKYGITAQEMSTLFSINLEHNYYLGKYNARNRGEPCALALDPESSNVGWLAKYAWVDGAEVEQLYGKTAYGIRIQLCEIAEAFSELEVMFTRKDGSKEVQIQKRIFSKPNIRCRFASFMHAGLIDSIEFNFDEEAIEELLNSGFLSHAGDSCPLCGLLPFNYSNEDELLKWKMKLKKDILEAPAHVREAWLNDLIELSCSAGSPCPLCAMIIDGDLGIEIEKGIDGFLNVLEDEKREKRQRRKEKRLEICNEVVFDPELFYAKSNAL